LTMAEHRSMGQGAANFGGLLHVFFDIEIDYKKAGRLTMVRLPIRALLSFGKTGIVQVNGARNR